MATEGMPAPHKPETTASTRFELCLKSGAEDRRPSARGLKPTSNAFDNFLWGQCTLQRDSIPAKARSITTKRLEASKTKSFCDAACGSSIFDPAISKTGP